MIILAEKVDSVMSTEIALDTLKASKSLKSLTQIVKTSTSAWKAQEAQMKSAGEYLKASEARYNGLGRSISAQKSQLEALKSKQSEINASTTKGANEWAKYQTKIDNATTKLKSMESQQMRAKTALDREKSGLNDLSNAMNQRNKISDATSKRLEAEGNQLGALREKQSNTKKNIEDMSVALKKEQELLNNMPKNASASAITKSKVDIEKLKTAIAESKNEASKFGTEISDIKPTGLERLKAAFGGVTKESKESGHWMSKLALGTTIANGFSNAVSNMTGHIKDSVKAGYELDEAGEKIGKQWKGLGLSNSQVQKMLGQIGDIRNKSNMAGTAVDSLQKRFYALTGSTKDARALTETVTAFGKASGLADEKIAGMAPMMSRLIGSTKVTSSLFTRVMGQAPELQKAIISASGMSQKAFTNALQNGKITGKQLEGYMVKASKNSGKAWAEFGSTSGGMLAKVQGMWKSTNAAFAKPLAENALNGISKAMSSLYNKNGELNKTGKSVQNIAKTLGEKAGDGIGKSLDWIVENRKALSSIVGSLGKITKYIGSGVWSTFYELISKLANPFSKSDKAAKGLSKSLSGIAGQKKVLQTLGKVMGGILVVKTALKFAGAIKTLATNLKLLTITKAVMNFLSFGNLTKVATAMKGFGEATKGATLAQKAMLAVQTVIEATNPFGWVILGATLLGSLGIVLYKTNKGFRNFINGSLKKIGKAAKVAFSSMKKAFTGKLGWEKKIASETKAMGKKWSSFKKDFAKSWKNHWKNAKKYLGDTWNDSVKVTKSFGKSMGKWWTGYKKDFASSWKSHWKNTKNYLSSSWNGMIKTSKSFYSKSRSILGTFGKGFRSSWSSLGAGLKNIWKKAWNGIKTITSNSINGIIGAINGGISGIDWVINKFGGKKNAIGKIPKVHFATGTQGINKITRAVVNDGYDSPKTQNKELIFRNNGNVEYSNKRNAETVLYPGDEVANARDSAMLAPALGIEHFANGSLGDLFGNVVKTVQSKVSDGISGAVSFAKKAWSSAKNMFDIAKKFIANPKKALNGIMKNNASSEKGVFKTLGKGMFKAAKSQVSDWWSSLWSMVDIDGGGAGGSWRHNPGLSETNGFGAARSFGSHDGVDFSGKLGSSILAVHGGTVTQTGAPGHGWPESQLGKVITVKSSDGYQEIYQEFGGMNNIKVKPGDEIHTGQKIATLGTLHGAGSGPHVHIGVSKGSLWNHGGSSTKGWFDVTKMHGGSDGSKKSKKTSTVLDKLIKSEVGSGFFSFIHKLAEKFSDDVGGSMGSGSSVQRWKPYVIKALKANGFSASASQIAAWMKVIARESNGNPKAVNNWDSNAQAGIPSKGLVQTIEPTFNAYKFKGHDNILNGYDDLLAGIHYAKAKYGSGSSMFSRVATEGYANGGLSLTHKLTQISEGNKPEMVIPLDITKRDRANQLLGQTVTMLAKTDPANKSHSVVVKDNEDLSGIAGLLQRAVNLLAGLAPAIYDAMPTDKQLAKAVKNQNTIQTQRYNRSRGLNS